MAFFPNLNEKIEEYLIRKELGLELVHGYQHLCHEHSIWFFEYQYAIWHTRERKVIFYGIIPY